MVRTDNDLPSVDKVRMPRSEAEARAKSRGPNYRVGRGTLLSYLLRAELSAGPHPTLQAPMSTILATTAQAPPQDPGVLANILYLPSTGDIVGLVTLTSVSTK